MSLVDLKMSKQDMKEESSPSYQQNPYPGGVALNLDTDELEKLGITSKSLPEVGDEYHIRAIGKVTRVSENETEGSDYSCGLCIQITALELNHEDEKPGEMEDVASEEAESAESDAVAPKTLLRSTYRGKG